LALYKSLTYLTSTPTLYRLSGRQFYKSKDPTNSIKVLKKKRYKGKKEKKQTAQNTHIQTKHTIKRDTYKTQQVY